MKKALIILLLIFLILLPVWSGGDEEGDDVVSNKCNGTIKVNLCDIEVTGPLEQKGYQLIVGELDMKEPYVKYEAIKDGPIKGAIPIINLDLYGQKKYDSKIIAIQDMDSETGISVKVSIPISLFREFEIEDVSNLKIYVYVDNKYGWVESGDILSGIDSVSKSVDGIDFFITNWPSNDRMIACMR